MTVAELERELKAEEALGRQLEEYVGRWVAIKNREIVADAASAEALLGKIEPQEVEAIYRVPKGEPGAAFL